MLGLSTHAKAALFACEKRVKILVEPAFVSDLDNVAVCFGKRLQVRRQIGEAVDAEVWGKLQKQGSKFFA